MRRKNERYNEPVVRGVVAQLRELRHARNLSQKQVFSDTDINIGRIESGRGNISVSTLADLCAYQSTKHFGIGISLFAAGVFSTVETTGLLCSVRHARLTDR